MNETREMSEEQLLRLNKQASEYYASAQAYTSFGRSLMQFVDYIKTLLHTV